MREHPVRGELWGEKHDWFCVPPNQRVPSQSPVRPNVGLKCHGKGVIVYVGASVNRGKETEEGKSS